MKILVFEWLTGGGHWIEPDSGESANSIQSQGLQMAQAITADFLESDIDVVLPIGGRLSHRIHDHAGLEKRLQSMPDDLAANLGKMANEVDHVMVIAPESRSCLLTCLDWLRPWASKLISPGIGFARVASCKQTTFDFLLTNRFDSFPQGINFAEFDPELSAGFSLPLVLKPIDGAGGDEVQLVNDWRTFRPKLAQSPERYRLEDFIGGMPVSVSALCGPNGNQVLPPTRQVFDRQPFGNYVGASYPIEPDLAERAVHLATRAIAAMPKTKGYVGLDMVLSDRPDQQDCLIEINPRLTMSYLKLREVCSVNLAKLMLDIATGRQ